LLKKSTGDRHVALVTPSVYPSLVVGITILLWATSLLPEFITALLFFAVAMVAKSRRRM
jgi:hypothetical protein